MSYLIYNTKTGELSHKGRKIKSFKAIGYDCSVGVPTPMWRIFLWFIGILTFGLWKLISIVWLVFEVKRIDREIKDEINNITNKWMDHTWKAFTIIDHSPKSVGMLR
jgi:hypothetical protein